MCLGGGYGEWIFQNHFSELSKHRGGSVLGPVELVPSQPFQKIRNSSASPTVPKRRREENMAG